MAGASRGPPVLAGDHSGLPLSDSSRTSPHAPGRCCPAIQWHAAQPSMIQRPSSDRAGRTTRSGAPTSRASRTSASQTACTGSSTGFSTKEPHRNASPCPPASGCGSATPHALNTDAGGTVSCGGLALMLHRAACVAGNMRHPQVEMGTAIRGEPPIALAKLSGVGPPTSRYWTRSLSVCRMTRGVATRDREVAGERLPQSSIVGTHRRATRTCAGPDVQPRSSKPCIAARRSAHAAGSSRTVPSVTSISRYGSSPAYCG